MRRLVPVLIILLLPASAEAEGILDWKKEFPRTDFSRRDVDPAEIKGDGMTRDSIPPMTNPRFIPAKDDKSLGPDEPVISLIINGDARAYPLQILVWHEIVNDTVGGVPVLVSYCPLCNSGIVFERRVDGRALEFGNTGRLRYFDMIMYDTKTESWWQQIGGRAMMGELTGTELKAIPSRLESITTFQARAPDGKLLVPDDANARPYGATPYSRMDTSLPPRQLFPWDLPLGITPFNRVVVVNDEAWPVGLLRRKKRIETDALVLTWTEGQNSIHDNQLIPFGRDVGNVVVQRKTPAGLRDALYDVAFAFAFAAFKPRGVWHTE